MLLCQNLTKQYGSLVAVNNLNLQILPGHVYALLGPNGSGKSTLMKLITGITKPNFGGIYFENMPLSIQSKEHIAYMPTENFFYPYMSAIDAGKFYQDFYQDFSMDKYIDLLQRMQLPPTQKVRKMSSGMMAKCKVALTLSRDAHLIMLDEPLNGIDLIARDKVMDVVMRSITPEKTIIISSHLVDELEQFCDEAIFMNSGNIILAGNCEQLRAQHQKSLVQMYKDIYAY